MFNRVGQKLGNYRLVRLTGHGGFADVYLGEHIYLNTPAAIKVLHSCFSSEMLQNFFTEARMIARLNHPNIVRVLDFGIEDRLPFLVMHYAPYGTLRQQHPLGDEVNPSTIVSYLKQVAAALQYAHSRNIIHRDIKPENMLCNNDGAILLSDFGIAVASHIAPRSNEMHDLFNPGHLQLFGTTTYMAPEQFCGEACYASDQYALAIVVYEWFCGSPPFTGSNLQIALNHVYTQPAPMRSNLLALNPAIEQVVMKALAKIPCERFARIQDFADELEAVCQPTTSRTYSRLSILEQPTVLNVPAQFLIKDNKVSLAKIPSTKFTHSVLEHIRRSSSNMFTYVSPEKSAAMSLLNVASLTHDIQNIGGKKLILPPVTPSPIMIYKHLTLPIMTSKHLTSPITIATNSLLTIEQKKRWPLLAFVIICLTLALVPLLMQSFEPAKKYTPAVIQIPKQTITSGITVTSHPMALVSPTPVMQPSSVSMPPQVLPGSNPNQTFPTTISMPSPTATPIPSPTPTLGPPSPEQFVVMPSSYNPRRCMRNNDNYRCIVTLFLSPSYQNSLSWQASSDINARFSTSQGVLTPGQLQQIIAYIPRECPERGVLIFQSTNVTISVRWRC